MMLLLPAYSCAGSTPPGSDRQHCAETCQLSANPNLPRRCQANKRSPCVLVTAMWILESCII